MKVLRQDKSDGKITEVNQETVLRRLKNCYNNAETVWNDLPFQQKIQTLAAYYWKE